MKQITEYISKAPTEHREIMETIRSLIYQSVKDVTGEFKWSRLDFKAQKDFANLQDQQQFIKQTNLSYELILIKESELNEEMPIDGSIHCLRL